MARLLDYQFDTFYTDSATGERKITNEGTNGTANDAVMYTGQGLYTDGVDDKIETINPSFLRNGGAVIKHAQMYDTSRDGIWDGTNRLYLSRDLLGWGSAYGSYNGQIPEAARLVMSSQNNTNVSFYSNGALLGTLNGSIDADFIHNYAIGSRSDDLTKTNANHFLLCFLDQYMTDADVLYDYQNPEAIITMFVTQTDNQNFSFSYTNIRHLFTFDEGSGNTIYDLVTGLSYNMTNFPTDNTQWTNADESQYSHQKARFKKDINGNPSAPADPNTIRLD